MIIKILILIYCQIFFSFPRYIIFLNHHQFFFINQIKLFIITIIIMQEVLIN